MCEFCLPVAISEAVAKKGLGAPHRSPIGNDEICRRWPDGTACDVPSADLGSLGRLSAVLKYRVRALASEAPVASVDCVMPKPDLATRRGP